MTVSRLLPIANERKGQVLVDEMINSVRPAHQGPELAQNTMNRAAEDLLVQVDSEHGGFGRAPKFPYPTLFRFLWNQGIRANRPDFQDAVTLTLDKMAMGGLFDHVGGGFFRYAVDRRWHMPHFEKCFTTTRCSYRFTRKLQKNAVPRCWAANSCLVVK